MHATACPLKERLDRLPAALRALCSKTARRSSTCATASRRRPRRGARRSASRARRTLPRWQPAVARGRPAAARPRRCRATAATSCSSATPSTAISSRENLAAAERVLARRRLPPAPGRAEAGARPLCCGRTYPLGRPGRRGARRGAAHARRARAVRRARRARRRARALLPLHLPRRVPQPPAEGRGDAARRRPRSCSRSCSRPTSPPARSPCRLRDQGGRKAHLHGHCHQKAFGGMGAVEAVLRAVPGLEVEVDRVELLRHGRRLRLRPEDHRRLPRHGRAVALPGGAQGRPRTTSSSPTARAAATRSTTASAARRCMWRACSMRRSPEREGASSPAMQWTIDRRANDGSPPLVAGPDPGPSPSYGAAAPRPRRLHHGRRCEWTIDRQGNDGSPPPLPGPIRPVPIARGRAARPRRLHDARRCEWTIDKRGMHSSFAVRGVPPSGGRSTRSRGSATPGMARRHRRAAPHPRSGEGDRPTGPAFGRPDDRLRRWRGQGRARSRGQGRRPSDQSRGAPATVRVAAPSTMLRMVPSPARAGEDRAIAGLHPARSHRTKRRQRGLDREPATKVNDRQTRAAFILSSLAEFLLQAKTNSDPRTVDARLLTRAAGRGTAEGGGGGRTRTVRGARAVAPSDAVPQRCHHGARGSPPPPCFAWSPSPAARGRIARSPALIRRVPIARSGVSVASTAFVEPATALPDPRRRPLPSIRSRMRA